MLGDMTNIVCKFSSKTISNFFDDIRKPALKLLSVYIAQVRRCFLAILYICYYHYNLFMMNTSPGSSIGNNNCLEFYVWFIGLNMSM